MARGSSRAAIRSVLSSWTWRRRWRASPAYRQPSTLTVTSSSGRSVRKTDIKRMGERRERGLKGLHQAFDEVRFGPSRTLNLRSALPTAADASHRVRNWLRQQQVAGAKEVLVVTGRGNNSDDGVPVVKDACVHVFHELRRKNVIVSFSEHTPGSFVVALAPMSALLEIGRAHV